MSVPQGDAPEGGKRSLAPSSARFGTLYEVAQLLSSSLDLEVVLQRVMDAVVAVTAAERGFVLLTEADGALRVAVARNLNREEIDSRESGVSRSLCDRVFATGEAVLVGDAQQDERTAGAESIISLRLRSVLCVPLKTKGTTIGVVYLDHRVETGRFGRRQMRLLEAVAEQAAIAIENARLYHDLREHAQEIAGLKAYQDSIFTSVSTAIVGLDTGGHVLSLNRAAEELFGVLQGQALGTPYSSLLGEAVSQRLLRGFAAASSGKGSGAVRASGIVNGAERYLRCAISPLRDGEGAATGLVLLAEDETARVQAEHAREREETERRRIRELFGRYVAEPIVEQLVSNPGLAQLGGQRREVSVVFADIRGYTTLSEQNTPEDLVVILSRYLAVAADSVMEAGGTLDKFMGDGVMALFNAPLDQADHALAAVSAAWQMQQRAKTAVEGVTFGVGVNTGEAIVGNLGTERFRNYSSVGDAVNVAARLQAHAQGGEVLLTRATLDQLRDKVRAEPLGPIEVKGRHEPVDVYRLVEVQL